MSIPLSLRTLRRAMSRRRERAHALTAGAPRLQDIDRRGTRTTLQPGEEGALPPQ